MLREPWKGCKSSYLEVSNTFPLLEITKNPWGAGGGAQLFFFLPEVRFFYAFIQGIWFWLLSETGNWARWTLALISSGNSDAGKSKKGGDRLVLSLACGFYSPQHRNGHGSCFHGKERQQREAAPGHWDFQPKTFSFTTKCADRHFWIPLLATCFACLRGFAQKTATRCNSTRKQTLTAFCTSQDPAPLFSSPAAVILFLWSPQSLPAQESEKYPLTGSLLPSEMGLTPIFMFVFTFCACLALHRAPEQVLVMMLPFPGPFPVRKCPTCGTSLGQHQCGGTLHHRLRGG